MPTELLHGLRFDPHKVLDGEWVDHENPFGDVCKAKTVEHARGLTVTRTGAFYDGVPLHNVQYCAATHSMRFGAPEVEGPIGTLYLNAPMTQYVGMWASSPSAAPQTVRGVNTSQLYSTELTDANAKTSKGPDLMIGTKWVQEPFGDILKQVVMLGDRDVSSRCAVSIVEDMWTYSYSMRAENNPISGSDPSTFSIKVVPHPGEQPVSTFSGTYTDNKSVTYNWKGTSITQTSNSLEDAAHLSLLNTSVENLSSNGESTRAFEAPASAIASESSTDSLSLSDLLNVSTMTPDGKTADGENKYLDRAQDRTAEYFQNLLLASLDESWRSSLYGDAPYLTPGCKVLQEKHATWLKAEAVPNMGLILHDNVTDSTHSSIVAKINRDKIAEHYSSLSSSTDYEELSQALYIEGYGDAVPGITPYLKDKEGNWGEKFHDYITSDAFLNVWAVQVASNEFKNVKEVMYELWVKLTVLCPKGSTKPNEALSVMYSTILNSQYTNAKWIEDMKPQLAQAIENLLHGTIDFKDEILQKNAQEQRKIAQSMVSGLDNEAELLDILNDLFTLISLEREKAVSAVQEDEVVAVIENGGRFGALRSAFSTWGTKAFACLKVIGFGAIAGYFLYQVIGDKGADAPADIGLTVIATGFIIKGMESFLATSLGRWLTTTISGAAGDGILRGMLTKFTNWFSKEGVVSESWVVRVLGKSSGEFFGRRFGPALAVFAIALCAISLSKAIKTGDTTDIIFESLNLVVAVCGVVFIGLELINFAWAGPVGLFIAAIGIFIAVFQLVWNQTHPPSPPPDPVENFVNGPLQDAGYTK